MAALEMGLNGGAAAQRFKRKSVRYGEGIIAKISPWETGKRKRFLSWFGSNERPSMALCGKLQFCGLC